MPDFWRTPANIRITQKLELMLNILLIKIPVSRNCLWKPYTLDAKLLVQNKISSKRHSRSYKVIYYESMRDYILLHKITLGSLLKVPMIWRTKAPKMLFLTIPPWVDAQILRNPTNICINLILPKTKSPWWTFLLLTGIQVRCRLH